MKIIKFKKKEKFKYKRKVIIKDLILNISIGIHNFEKKRRQRVKFNIEILTNPYVIPNNKDLNSILNYEEIISSASEGSSLLVGTNIFEKYTIISSFNYMVV